MRTGLMYSGGQRTIGIPGSRWFWRAHWPILERDDGDRLRTLLVKLRGGGNRLLMHDIAQPTFRGAGGGSPLVAGASQLGYTLNIDGCSPNITNWALQGDKFTVNGEMKIIVAPANTNGSGQTSITFEPALRAAPADNAPLTISYPVARFVITSSDVMWMYETVVSSNIELSGEEAFI